MNEADKQATCRNTAAQMKEVPLFIRQRHVRACHHADPEYGAMLAQALGINLDKAPGPRIPPNRRGTNAMHAT